MTEIIIYTKDHCPYCAKAKQLLTIKKQKFTEIDIGKNPEKREEMVAKVPNARTVPQIIINGKPIGGCDDLHALNDKGELDKLLAI